MTVEVTKTANEKFSGVLELSRLLENLSDPEVVFKSFPELYFQDLKNHSIIFEFMKRALTYEEDAKLKIQLETSVQNVLLQKMSEKKMNNENLTLIFHKAYTHWSNVMLIVQFGTVNLFNYSVINRSLYFFDLDETIRNYDTKISGHMEILNSIQDRETAHFRAKKVKLQDSVDNWTDKKNFIVDNRVLLDTIQAKFQEIFTELNG